MGGSQTISIYAINCTGSPYFYLAFIKVFLNGLRLYSSKRNRTVFCFHCSDLFLDRGTLIPKFIFIAFVIGIKGFATLVII